MKHFMTTMLVVVFLFSAAGIFAAEPDFPVIKGKKVVATVNGEPITLDEFKKEIASPGSEEKKVDTKKQSEILRRLINARLIIQEAKQSGIGDLPEIKKRVEVFSRVTLREELMDRHVKNIKPDPKEVEKLYKESVKEWKMSSALFDKEDDAKSLEKAVKGGKDFEKTLKNLVSDGKAKESEVGKYFKNKELLPEIAAAVGKMKVGEISPVIRLKTGFVVLRLEDIRFIDNEEAKEMANMEVLKRKQGQALIKYEETLKKKYVKVNQKVLDSINYDVKEPEFQRLLKDQRILAEITGEKPITVGELTDALRQQLYHGVGRALESKRLTKKKVSTLEELLHKRVFLKEALRLGIDQTDSFKSKVKEHENSLIFGAYVQKAIAPDIKLQEKELETHYNEHIKEFTYPEMIRIDGLAFGKRKNAEEAIEKLRKGVELKWLMEHAEGQVDKNAEGIMSFEGKLLTVKDLPDGLPKAVSGARSGDFKLYESPKGHFYVLAIQEVVPSKPQPYTEARGEIAKRVYNEKMVRAVEDLADKLRAMSDVKIYLKIEK
jgi:parvulin-like peptidyl-prolyl isomerase